jgi:hypothetical protein
MTKIGAAGFAFVTNQPITDGVRAKLAALASPGQIEIYHLDRLAHILDTPKVYGVRLDFLEIGPGLLIVSPPAK